MKMYAGLNSFAPMVAQEPLQESLEHLVAPQRSVSRVTPPVQPVVALFAAS